MLTQVLIHDPAAFRGRPRQRQREYEALYLRRLVTIALERTAMTRVPMLDWPADLFVDVGPEIAA
jgi:hypothetical protein